MYGFSSDSEKATAQVIGFVLGVLGVATQGWALSLLWNWFVVPLGVMPITSVWAIGLSLFGTVLRGVDRSSTELENWDTAVNLPLRILLLNIVVIIAGWFIQTWM